MNHVTETVEFLGKIYKEKLNEENNILIGFSDYELEKGLKKNKYNNVGVLVSHICSYDYLKKLFNRFKFAYKINIDDNSKIFKPKLEDENEIYEIKNCFEIYGKFEVMEKITKKEIFENYYYCLNVIKNYDYEDDKKKIFNNIPKKFKTDEMYFSLIKNFKFNFLDKIKTKNYEICLESCKNNINNLSSVPEEYCDYNFFYELVDYEPMNFHLVPEKYRKNELCIMALRDEDNIKKIPNKILNDEKFIKELLNANYRNLPIYTSDRILFKKFVKFFNKNEENKKYFIEKRPKKALTMDMEKDISIPKKILTYDLCYNISDKIYPYQIMKYIPKKYRDKKMLIKIIKNIHIPNKRYGSGHRLNVIQIIKNSSDEVEFLDKDIWLELTNNLTEYNFWKYMPKVFRDNESILILFFKNNMIDGFSDIKKIKKCISNKLFESYNFWEKVFKVNKSIIKLMPEKYLDKILKNSNLIDDYLSEDTKEYEALYYLSKNNEIDIEQFKKYGFLNAIKTLIDDKLILKNKKTYKKLKKNVDLIYQKMDNYFDNFSDDIKKLIDVIIKISEGKNNKYLYYIDKEFYQVLSSMHFFSQINGYNDFFCDVTEKKLNLILEDNNNVINFILPVSSNIKKKIIDIISEREIKNAIFVDWKNKIKKLTVEQARVSVDINVKKYKIIRFPELIYNFLGRGYLCSDSSKKHFFWEMNNFCIDENDDNKYKNLIIDDGDLSNEFTTNDFFYVFLHRYKELKDNNFEIQLEFPFDKYYLKLAKYIPSYLEEIIQYKTGNNLKIDDITKKLKQYISNYDKSLSKKINKNNVNDCLLERVEWKENISDNNKYLNNYEYC
jgi:hypothetical protein